MAIYVLEKSTAELLLKTVEYSCWYAPAFSLIGVYITFLHLIRI